MSTTKRPWSSLTPAQQDFVRANGEDVVTKEWGVARRQIREWKAIIRALPEPALAPLPELKALEDDWQRRKLQRQAKDATKREEVLLREIEQLRREKEVLLALGDRQRRREELTFTRGTGKKRQATALIMASDWHPEEPVDPVTVNGQNAYDLDIFKERSANFFHNAAKLVKKERQSLDVPHVLFAGLGDFITGNIHEDLQEIAELPPIKAMLLVQDVLEAGLKYLCDELAPTTVSCVWVDGNHDRITKMIRVANRKGNSLAYYMYKMLEKLCPKIQMDVAEGLFAYTQVYNTTVRARHGDDVRYNGGVGGLYVPMSRAILRDNSKLRHADLDLFGHFHTQVDLRFALGNGSLIGFGPFAQWIHASYERPQQTFALIDADEGLTGTFPILVSHAR